MGKLSDFDFENDLKINKYKLDEECLSHASLYFRYAEASVDAKKNLSKVKDELELVKSTRNLELREELTSKGLKVTEALVNSALLKDEAVIEATENVRKAEYVFGKISVAVEAMESRKSELDNLVKLYCSGYFSSPSGVKKSDVNEQASKEVRKNLNRNKE